MKDILMIAHFTQIPGEAGNGRFHYLAEKINKDKAKVEVVTSKFSHRTKKYRKLTKEQEKSISYKLTMLKELSYNNNVSIKRFFSHYLFSKSLKRYLKKRNKPDIVYCSVPSLDVAMVAAKYANENKVRFIIDIQDLWPEAFKMVLNLPIISDILYRPMKKKANYIYSSADSIFAVSETYIKRALAVNKKNVMAKSIYLGTDLSYFDKLAEYSDLINKSNNEIWIAYIGTLGNSYDIPIVVDALKLLKDGGHQNIKFIVMGDGPLKEEFENYSEKKDVYVKFTGRLDYDQMVRVLKKCDIAVNPIKAGSAGSVINKVGDYAAAGLPVINTQENKEYRDLIEKYSAGINCDNKNVFEMANSILYLKENPLQRKLLGENNRKLAEEKFNREKTYSVILLHLVSDE